ncbi:MAG: DUF58 domain-containing protein [Burkholderiaceae bacterium]
MADALPHPLRHPVGHLRARVQRWWNARVPPQDSVVLTQRTVYILPTRAGFMLGATLLVLLVASINYQLNLGYLLTFLLAGAALSGMHLSHGTLRGLSLHLLPPDPTYQGASATLGVVLASERKHVRHGIGLSLLGLRQWVWTDVPGQGRTTVHVTLQFARRGLQSVPALTAETRFPLGTFRVWTVWRPASRVLVYPRPEASPPPLPAGEPRTGGALHARVLDSGEYDGVRAYRRGDPLKLVVWKKVAKADQLVSRDTQQAQRFELRLDLAQTGVPHAADGPGLELALSRLCAWVRAADAAGLDYGLRLADQEISPGNGQAHARRCLEALALYRSDPHA